MGTAALWPPVAARYDGGKWTGSRDDLMMK